MQGRCHAFTPYLLRLARFSLLPLPSLLPDVSTPSLPFPRPFAFFLSSSLFMSRPVHPLKLHFPGGPARGGARGAGLALSGRRGGCREV